MIPARCCIGEVGKGLTPPARFTRRTRCTPRCGSFTIDTSTPCWTSTGRKWMASFGMRHSLSRNELGPAALPGYPSRGMMTLVKEVAAAVAGFSPQLALFASDDIGASYQYDHGVPYCLGCAWHLPGQWMHSGGLVLWTVSELSQCPLVLQLGAGDAASNTPATGWRRSRCPLPSGTGRPAMTSALAI